MRSLPRIQGDANAEDGVKYAFRISHPIRHEPRKQEQQIKKFILRSGLVHHRKAVASGLIAHSDRAGAYCPAADIHSGQTRAF